MTKMNIIIQTMIAQASLAIIKSVIKSHTDDKVRAKREFDKKYAEYSDKLDKAQIEFQRKIDRTVESEENFKKVLEKHLPNIQEF